MRTALQILKQGIKIRTFKNADENYSVGAQDAVKQILKMIDSLETIETDSITLAYLAGYEDAKEGMPMQEERYYSTMYQNEPAN